MQPLDDVMMQAFYWDDEEAALKMQKKLQRNEFTLQDMLEQFQQVKKMGSMSKLLEMLPGMNGIDPSQLDMSGMKRTKLSFRV